jgi:hypothetical protein
VSPNTPEKTSTSILGQRTPTLKLITVCSSKILVSTYQTIRRHTKEYKCLNLSCCKYFKSDTHKTHPQHQNIVRTTKLWLIQENIFWEVMHTAILARFFFFRIRTFFNTSCSCSISNTILVNMFMQFLKTYKNFQWFLHRTVDVTSFFTCITDIHNTNTEYTKFIIRYMIILYHFFTT